MPGGYGFSATGLLGGLAIIVGILGGWAYAAGKAISKIVKGSRKSFDIIWLIFVLLPLVWIAFAYVTHR